MKISVTLLRWSGGGKGPPSLGLAGWDCGGVVVAVFVARCTLIGGSPLRGSGSCQIATGLDASTASLLAVLSTIGRGEESPEIRSWWPALRLRLHGIMGGANGLSSLCCCR